MARVGSGAFKASLAGDAALREKLKRIAGDQGVRKQARGALLELGGVLLRVMQGKTPVKTGRLLRSERLLVMVSPKREEMRVSLIAGGPTAPHARRVHELHPTKSKFMETTIREAAPTAGRELAEKIDLRRAAAGG